MSLKLKLLRKQANLTLEDLAQSTDLTRSYISKVERGLSTPSIGVALRMAKALGVQVEALFGSESAESSVVITRAEAAQGEHQVRGAPRIVAGTSPAHKMMAFVLKPGDNPVGKHKLTNHDGEEILFVLEGTILLEVAGKSETLGKGDCAHFDSSIPHRIVGSGADSAQVLLVINPTTSAT